MDVLVLEASDHPGGKLAGRTVADSDLDVGADAWLDRDEAMRDLVALCGLEGRLIPMATSGVWLWNHRGLHRLPPTAVMGLPSRPAAAVEVLGIRGAMRAAAERFLPRSRLESDVSVGEFVSRRFGRSVTTELVDPLLGGVYAGHVDGLSLNATIPALAEMSSARTVTAALRSRQAAPPAFLTLRGGLHQLPSALADRLGDRLQVARPVQAIEGRDGWVVHTDEGPVTARRVVLACPAPAVEALTRPHDEHAADQAAGIAYTSVGVVACAYPPDASEVLPDGTGMLVARSAGRFIKAATWVSQKWGRPVGPEPLLVRSSVGRVDDQRHRDMGDDEVIERVATDLADAVGLRDHTDAVVVRWDNALPQYEVGHLEKVDAVRASLARSMPNVHVVGAAWDGVGVGPLATAAARLADQLVA